jgi:hypothetical protein
LRLASKIQEAKMEHQLLQQQVAIAEAQKKLALSHEQTMNLSSSNAFELSNSSEAGTLHLEGLRLAYVAKVSGGQRQATLQRGNELIHVQSGTDLGAGRRVIAVLANGVWLADQEGEHWLGFPGELPPSKPVVKPVGATLPLLEPKREKIEPLTTLAPIAESTKGVIAQKTPNPEPIKTQGAFAPSLSENPPELHFKTPAWLDLKSFSAREKLPSRSNASMSMKQNHELSSDEMLFLEQPGEGITLLTPANQDTERLKKMAYSQEINGSYVLTVEGNKQLALGLFKTASAARLKALAVQQIEPDLQITPMNVKLLQESVLRR